VAGAALPLEHVRKPVQKRLVPRPNQIPDQRKEQPEIPQSEPAAHGLVDRPGRRILKNSILLDQFGEYPLVGIPILADVVL
jgi:hypothetical protein